MNIKKAISAGLLGFCGALVFFVISGDETASADYSNGAAELAKADDAEEFLDELEYVLGMLEGVEVGSEQQKSFLEDLSSILFTWNSCWLISCAKGLLDDPACPITPKHFVDLTSKLGQLETFLGFGSEGEAPKQHDYPYWYYHFAPVGDPLSADSYIKIGYTDSNQKRPVRGWIWFCLDRDNNGVCEDVAAFPVVWNVVPNTEQTIYFSCYLDSDEVIQGIEALRILGLYKSLLGGSGARRTFYTYRFCEDYHCNPNDWTCVGNCLGDMFLTDLISSPQVSGGVWESSPLLVLVPLWIEWFFGYDSPDYFDSIILWASEDIEIVPKRIMLNSEPLFDCSKMEPPEPMCVARTIGPDAALDFTGAVERYRLSQLGLPSNQITPLLKEAAKNIGQALAEEYGCVWEKHESGDYEAWAPWHGRYWCSEFACWWIEYYSDLLRDDWPEDYCRGYLDVDDMWDIFGREELNEYRISPLDIFCPIPWHCWSYEWEDLAWVVKAGYYVGLRGPGGIHSTFFIEWESFDPDACYATFRAIGGNQGGGAGKITVATFRICNATRPECIDECNRNDVRYWWTDSNDTTFFGKTWH